MSWTKEELKYLRRNVGVIPSKEIAEKLGKNLGAVRMKAIRLGMDYKVRRDVPKTEEKPKRKPKWSLVDINAKARDEGLSYGQYVARYGL